MTGRRGHLAAVPDQPPGPALADRPATRAPGARPRVTLTRWQRIEVEEVRCLLIDAVDASPAELGPPRSAYLAGRLEGAARNLLDILDAITEVNQ